MVSLRICLVTPFAWSQPHEVNDHVRGVSQELRKLGHDVTVLAPSNRAADLRAGRRALQQESLPDVVAIGPALPISRRSAMGVPVGSEEATKWYAEQVLAAGCAMVNCMPVFIAREPYWQKRFKEAGVPIIGDDIKSQVGATITHRVLTSLFRDRGVRLDRTMQLNVGGNSDFLNMLERSRLESKKNSKTNAVTSMLDYDLGDGNVHVGPSDYVPWLTDRKWAYIRMEATTFGNVPLNVELKLEVWDSPNSAGIVIDAVRMAKLALNNGVAGALEAPSSYLMKSPPKQIRDDDARELTERFIKDNRRTKTKTHAKT